MNRPHRFHRIPAILGGATLAGVAALLASDLWPGMISAAIHDLLAALSLALIAVAYLLYQAERRPARWEWLKAALLAAAFLCWAANQFWPQSRWAVLLNDVAIGLFILEVFLVMIGWPGNQSEESFAESQRE
jgi:peptidoglycan/LPS O-acetylase OafA/YrhL